VAQPAAAGWSFQKFTKRTIDWAIVGVAVQGGAVALMNRGSAPLRATATEQALAGETSPREAPPWHKTALPLRRAQRSSRSYKFRCRG
jgi:carbon-monoxide dehydrogenase medium subunit